MDVGSLKIEESCEKVRKWSCDPSADDWELQSPFDSGTDSDYPVWSGSTEETPFRDRTSSMGAGNLGQTGLILLTVLACGTFFIQFNIFRSIHTTPTKAEEFGKLAESVPFEHQISIDTADLEVIIPSNHNFYISVKDYVPRKNPAQHVEQIHKQGANVPTAYKLVAELGHRYGAKYIIDIGCGTAKYLGQLSKEFRIIGIDYGINLERAKQAYPELTFLDVNLDKGKGCTLTLPEDILFQSIVISAEVIEHLVDPMYCYMKVLHHLSAYVAAIVVSSPDRKRLTDAFLWQHRLAGPPVNKHHVREWSIEEMPKMFKDIGIPVVMSAWVCGRNKKCSTGYSVKKNPFVSQLLVLGNSNVRKVWEDKLIPLSIKFTTFVFIHAKTSPILLNHSLTHLVSQGSQLVLFTKRCNVTLARHPSVIGKFYIDKTADSLSIMKAVMSSEVHAFKYGDWFMVQDAHEIISIPSVYNLANFTLRHYLQQVALEPYGFNAVPMTIISMSAAKTLKNNDRLPFRIHSISSWDHTDGSTIYPRRDTLQDKVRVWRKTLRSPRFFTSSANKTGPVITDVHFLGRRVYPFHLQSLRFSPQVKHPISNLSLSLSRMYGLEIGVGYTSAIRKSVFQKRLPY